jgi:hypothetical protein
VSVSGGWLVETPTQRELMMRAEVERDRAAVERAHAEQVRQQAEQVRRELEAKTNAETAHE